MKNTLLNILLFVSLQLSFQRVYAQYYVSTYAGQTAQGFVNGSVDSASFKNPFGLCRDHSGNIFIADGNNCIRKIEFATGIVSTYAGTGVAGFRDGPSDSAQFNAPSDLCVDDSGNVYVSDFLNQRIRKISVQGNVTTIAGNGTAGYVDGSVNTRFNYPRGICRDEVGNLYVGDSWNHRIRRIDPAGNVSTYAGGGTAMGVGSTGSYIDGADTSARFYTPSGLAIDKSGNVYVADAYNHRIRMIDTSRVVSTLAGSGATGQGNGGYANGNFSSSIFNTVTELYFDTLHNKLYISDTFNNRVRVADLNSTSVYTLAGNGVAGNVNDVDSLAEFNFPRGLVADTSGDVYLCDYNNHSVKLIGASNINSVSEISSEEIIIYPNPSSASFNIRFNTDEVYSIKLYDYQGQFIRNYSQQCSSIRIDLSQFQSGIYFAKIFKADKVICTSRLILQ